MILTCPSCNGMSSIADAVASDTVQCPHCQGFMAVPVAPETPAVQKTSAFFVPSPSSGRTNFRCSFCGNAFAPGQGQVSGAEAVCWRCLQSNAQPTQLPADYGGISYGQFAPSVPGPPDDFQESPIVAPEVQGGYDAYEASEPARAACSRCGAVTPLEAVGEEALCETCALAAAQEQWSSGIIKPKPTAVVPAPKKNNAMLWGIAGSAAAAVVAVVAFVSMHGQPAVSNSVATNSPPVPSQTASIAPSFSHAAPSASGAAAIRAALLTEASRLRGLGNSEAAAAKYQEILAAGAKAPDAGNDPLMQRDMREAQVALAMLRPSPSASGTPQLPKPPEPVADAASPAREARHRNSSDTAAGGNFRLGNGSRQRAGSAS